MAKGKDAPEMFEAFQNARDDQKRPSPRGLKGAGSPSDVGGDASTSEGSRRTPPSWYPGVVDSDDVHVLSLGQRAQVVFALSYNALIVAIMVFVVFAFGMYFLGTTQESSPTPVAAGTEGSRKLGVVGEDKRPTKPASGGPARSNSTRPPVQPATPSPTTTKDVHYAVKLLDVRNTPERQRAVEEARRFLERQGVPDVKRTFPRRNTRIALWAGSFTEDERDKAEALKKRVRLMTVRGRREFAEAEVLNVGKNR